MLQKSILTLLLGAIWLMAACELNPKVPPSQKEEQQKQGQEQETAPLFSDFVRGADLSYVNEMVACGATYRDRDLAAKDPYVLFREAGTDLVRVRLWHSADWTEYSDYQDVKQTIQAAHAQGMQVLLDFHYSDDWADPGRQHIPAAWLGVVDDPTALGDSVYQYTYRVLSDLNEADLLPAMVQVGNEINAEILQDPSRSYRNINWTRNAALINRGLQAVRQAAEDFDTDIEVMLHIAQPENALWWFRDATASGVSNYDWIGLSYYPIWSDYDLTGLSAAVATLKDSYQKRVMVVETAYPFTLDNADGANNILGNDALVSGYAATEQGQLQYLQALENALVEGGAEGLIYWEPAWVSTSCRTQWGQGSHWDNATLFNHDYRANLGMQYFGGE